MSIALVSSQMCYSQVDSLSTQNRLNQYGKLVERKSLNAENRNGILVFESKDQEYRFWFDARVQIDGQVFSRNTYNDIGDGASIRRARFAVKANVTKNWYGELDLDFANGSLDLNDAYIAYDFLNGFSARAGNFKERFSMSQTASSRYLNFMERATVVTAFAPSRHIGVETAYNGKYFTTSAGIFFQEVGNAETRAFVEENSKTYGRDEGISATGKFVYQPFGDNPDKGIHIGYALSYRNPKTSEDPATYNSIRYNTRTVSSINRKKYLDTDAITDYSHQILQNIELAGFYKGLGVQGEYIFNTTYRKNGKENLNFSGFYIQTTYMVFGGKQFYNKSEGEFSEPYKGKKWGDVEAAFRYDYINLNDKDVYGGSASVYTPGINFYTAKNVKFQLNYSIVNHDRYANGKGKLFVGNDAAGNPTKDPAQVVDAKGKAGEDYNILGLRCEIDF
ncbi:OprO/OprP family phosphate-selective porin [Kaistella jeonii]|nr:porin [Kaistella jeonii]